MALIRLQNRSYVKIIYLNLKICLGHVRITYQSRANLALFLLKETQYKINKLFL